MMRGRKEPRPEPPMRWVRPEGATTEAPDRGWGSPPTTPATAEGFRRREREARQRAEAGRDGEVGSADG